MPLGAPILREKRRSLGLSQLEVATAAGVSVRTLQFAESCKTNVSSQKLRQIAGVIGVAEAEASQAIPVLDVDKYDRLPWSMSRYIQDRAAPGPECFCKDQDEALDVIRIMRKNWKYHLRTPGVDETGDQYEVAEQILENALHQYESRYLRIWNRHPGTFQLARANGSYCGVAVVLPVSDDAYEKLADGRISFMDIDENDIEDESQNIILDSAVEFFGLEQPPWHQLSNSLGFAVFCRIAALSLDPMADDFRMLSFAASPLNTKRLIALGFRTCKEVMPDYRYQILQFSLNGCDKTNMDYPTASTTALFAKLLRPSTLTSAASDAKRRMLTRGFRVLQNAVKDPTVNQS